MYYLSERDRQIQKSINAKVRAMPPVDTWRTSRRTFASGSAISTTAGEAYEDIASGASGKINLYQGPLSAPVLLVDPGGGAGGAFSSAFSTAFDIGTDEHEQIEAWNLTETPIWQGARVIVDKILLKGGQPESIGYVVVEHNSATLIRAMAISAVAAGGTGNFTNVIPVDGIYQPTTATIYCPTAVNSGGLVSANRNYSANRWEANPDEVGTSTSTPSYPLVAVFSGSNGTMSISDESIVNPLPLTASVYNTDTNLSVVSNEIIVAAASTYLITFQATTDGSIFSGSGYQALSAEWAIRVNNGSGYVGNTWLETCVEHTDDHYFSETEIQSSSRMQQFNANAKLKVVLWDWDDNGLGLDAPCQWSIVFMRIA